MKVEKKVMGTLEKCYSIAPLHYNGKDHILVAAEKQDPCQLFDLDGNYEETVWEGPGGTMSMISTFGSLALIILIFYFFMLRPQQKRDKEAQNMRSSLEVGDDIITIGGIVGTVVSLKEDTLVIETSGDRNKIRITRWAVQQNVTPKETSDDKNKK